MVHQEQLVSRLLFCFFFILSSCSKHENILRISSVDSELNLAKNVVVYKGLPFSGQAYALYPKSSDTLWTRNYKNGLKNGVWKRHYPAGELKEKRRFVNGKKEGDYFGYYLGGAQNFIFQFNNGEYNGTNRIWTKKGLLIEEGNFNNGYESGVQKTWYLNGKVKSNYIIKNNRRYGLLGTKNCVNVSNDLLVF
jgi:antitoxin component YwqK of YwqJK toxin-antitoxin module